MASRTSNNDTGYGIGAVAKLTGLTDHTIRVWERRYGAVVAERSASGRRVYSNADVEKLGLLKTLTDHGIAISQIAGNAVDELRALSRDLSASASVKAPAQMRAAILGDFLSSQLPVGEDTGSVKILVSDNDRERLLADLHRDPVDVLVYETAILNADTLDSLRATLSAGGMSRAVVVYGFGRRQDVDRIRDAGIVVLRSPVTTDDVHAAIARTFSQRPRDDSGREEPGNADEPATWAVDGEVPPRRFSQQQLAMLAATSTAVDCECPHHLAQLVRDLSAFEIYSAQCANRNDDDEALHRYLHHTTAQARVLIETALSRVAAAEGIDV